jgi:hypothetical protein
VLGSQNPIYVLEAVILEVLKLIVRKERLDRLTETIIKNHLRIYYKIEKISMRRNINKFEKRWQNLMNAINP